MQLCFGSGKLIEVIPGAAVSRAVTSPESIELHNTPTAQRSFNHLTISLIQPSLNEKQIQEDSVLALKGCWSHDWVPVS